MINTHIKFEGKIHYRSKVVAFKKLHQFFKFQGQFDLEGQGQANKF